MPNNYLIENPSFPIVQKEIESIITSRGFSQATRSVYDVSEESLENALEDLDTYSLFGSQKVIVIQNLFSEKEEHQISRLLKYIDNQSEDNLLFLTVDKIDSRLALSKKLMKHKNVTYLKKEVELVPFIKEKLASYQIDSESIHLLIEKCQEDVTRIDSECEKLMVYKIDSKKITKEDIETLVIKKLKDSSEVLFALSNALLERDKKKAFKIYKELEEYQLDIHSIIGLLASQLKLVSQIKVLKMDGLTNTEIQAKLKLKSLYQIKKLSEYTTYSLSQIGEMIHLLSELDWKIKSGRVDVNHALILFIIGL